MKFILDNNDIVDLSSSYKGYKLKVACPNKRDFIQGGIASSHSLYQEDVFKKIVLDIYIPDNPNVVDVGAYTGSSSLLLSTLTNASHTVSIEPDLQAYDILNKNIEINSLCNKIETVNVAIGDSCGSASLVANYITNLGSNRYRKCNSSVEDSIHLITLDELLKDRTNKIDILHISVEGDENLILRGAKNILIIDKPIIILNIWPPGTHIYNANYNAFCNYAKAIGELSRFNYKALGRYSSEKFAFIYKETDLK